MIKKALKVNWKPMIKIINFMSRETGRTRIDLFLDMLDCYKNHGFTWLNYMTFGFHKYKDERIRKSYMSELKDNINVIKKSHKVENIKHLDDKGLFSLKYKDFLGRDVIDLRVCSYKDFIKFIEKHRIFIIKPVDDEGGNGIERIVQDEKFDPKSFYDKCIKNSQLIIEEFVVQNEEMSKISINSLNTLRVATILRDDGKVIVPYYTLRFSLSDSYLDNASLGGVYTLINEEGRVDMPAYANLPYEFIFNTHPKTGFNFIGFKIPELDKVTELVKEAALVMKSSKYIGWDVAISNKGPLLIEGNDRPSVELFQSYIHMKNGMGKRDMMQEALGYKFEWD